MDASPTPLRRSQLGTPANERDLIETAVASATDEVFLDLEDSVAPGEKRDARSALVDAVDDLEWSSTVLSYRINGVHTRWWYEDVIEVVQAVGGAIDNVLVPKVTGPSELRSVVDLLRQVEINADLEVGSIGLGVQIENASSMTDVAAVVAAADRLTSAVFGPADYATSIGATGPPTEASDPRPERYWHYPLSRLSHAASSANLLAIGGPYADVDDLDGFRSWCRYERRLGYDGKLVLTPAQAAVVNEVFSPSREEAERARRIVDRYAPDDPHVVASIDGNVIDRETYEMAVRILRKAKRAEIV